MFFFIFTDADADDAQLKDVMMMLVYLQRLGRCEECAGGNKPSKVALKSKMGNFDKVL